MASLNTLALTWLRNHHGIISADQLQTCEVTRSTRLTLLHNGTLVPEHRGVYRVASQPVTLESRCAAMSAFQTDGFVTGPTGGRLYGLRRMGHHDAIQFATPHGDRLHIEGVRVRQTRAMDPTDRFDRGDGIVVASPWRLAFDLAADVEREDLESVIEQILAMRLCTAATLRATARRLAAPARPGSRAFVAALAGRLPGGPLESHPELLIARALHARGVPIVVQQTWLRLPNGKLARLDISVPEIRWGVEVDVHPDHFLSLGTADRRRDRQCHLIGWQVERVTAIDMSDIDALIDELVELYHARAEELGTVMEVPGAAIRARRPPTG